MYFQSRERTERIGYSFIFPSPLCVVKIRSRCPRASPRNTERNDRPLISLGPIPVAGVLALIASRQVGRRSTQLTIASDFVPGAILPGQTATRGVRIPAS